MHYYQHHIGDFIKDTSFLTNEEVGIYLKLLWLYYDSEKPLPNDVYTLSMKTNTRNCLESIDGILNMFFSLENDEWHHVRCDQEIYEYHSYINNKSKAGKASAEQRKNRNPTPVQQTINDCNTTVQLTTNHKPLTTNHIKTNTLAPKVAIPIDVTEEVWNDFVTLRKSKKASLTLTALKGISREADKANLSLQEVLEMCCSRGWAGFKADWITENKSTSINKPDSKMKDFWLQIEGNK